MGQGSNPECHARCLSNNFSLSSLRSKQYENLLQDFSSYFFCFSNGAACLPCRADDKARDRETLRGIQAVVVIVHPAEPEWQAELAKIGITASTLEALIEQQLNKADIPVLSMEAANRTEYEGVLNVRLKFLDPEPVKNQFPALDKKEDIIEKVDMKKRYLYAIRLNLRQLVALQRDPSYKVFSITWQTESVGMRSLTFIRKDIKKLVDSFVYAYTSENPATLKTN